MADLATTAAAAADAPHHRSNHDDWTVPYEYGSNGNGRLLKLVRRQRWAEAKDRVVSHPLEARVEHERYGTVLYQACLRGAPPELVAAFLQAFPKGPSVGLASSFRESPGTPLNASLMRYWIARDEFCMCGSLETMSLLIRTDVGALSTKNHRGKTPLEYLCHITRIEDVKTWRRTSYDGAGDGGGGNDNNISGSYPPEEPAKTWATVSFLVGESAAALWRQPNVPSPFGLLVPVPVLPLEEQSVSNQDQRHGYDAMCKAADLNCSVPIPRCLIKWIAECHFPDLLRPLAEADADGNLALHRFAADVHVDADAASAADCSLGGTDFDRFVGRMLLSMHPQAAEVRNRAGRLPLHLAASVCGGGGWGAMGASLGFLGDVFMVFPSALEVRDPVTGLLPFMIPSAGDVDVVGAAVNCDLNTTYLLLRADPEQVRSGIVVGRKQSLKRKVSVWLRAAFLEHAKK